MATCSYCDADVVMLCAKCGKEKTGLRCGACESVGFGICASCDKTLLPK